MNYKPRLANAPTQYHRCCTPKLEAVRRDRIDQLGEIGVRLAYLLIGVVIGVILCAATGCGPAPTPQTAAKIGQLQQQTMIAKADADAQVATVKAQAAAHVAQVKADADAKVATIQENARLDVANAEARPMRHPFLYLEQIVKAYRKPLTTIALISFLALAVGVGLHFYTPLSWLSKILVPVAGSVFAFSFTGLVVLPFMPWTLVAIGALLVIVFVYEWIRLKSPKAALDKIESDVESEIYGNGGSTPPAASSLSSVAAAAKNELATLEAKAEGLLGIAGTKAAPIVVTTPPPPPPAPVPVPVK